MGNDGGRFSDSRISLLSAPSHPDLSRKWPHADFVPGHSGGTVEASYPLPYYAKKGTFIILNYSIVSASISYLSPSVNTSSFFRGQLEPPYCELVKPLCKRMIQETYAIPQLLGEEDPLSHKNDVFRFTTHN